jgi:Sugar-binding N-terminal domain/Nucleotide-binding C-terminal domain
VITAVLDDDPTGTQAVRDVSVILDWSDAGVWNAVRPGDRAVHLLTNSRAYDAEGAAELTGSAARAARAGLPGSRIVLRGDSTLRAHVWEEYEALRGVLDPGAVAVPLMLVPALPAAGRVTLGGVHALVRDGQRIPLERTEYARDGVFAYSSSRLALWAQERSGGRLAAADAVEVDLARLRDGDGAAAVCSAIAAAGRSGRPAVVVPDAETAADLDLIAAGLRLAEAGHAPVIVRCAPAFVAALAGTGAEAFAQPPAGGRGVLLICGSFVPASTAQVQRLAEVRGEAFVPARVAALASEAWEAEVERIAAQARQRLESGGLAVVVTERRRDPALVAPSAQRRVAVALAAVARQVRAGVVIAKGGITSAVTAREGLRARVARVLGPICPGVALWRLSDGTDYVVVPGNVGDRELLAELVAMITAR